MNKKSKKNILAFFMAICMLLLSTGSVLTVMAATSNYTTHNGFVDFGKGDASITISGNKATTSLKGKKFRMYHLFHSKNSSGKESINYTFCEETKGALQNIVGYKLNKNSEKVSEYEVVDYIQSLNSHVTEGADAVQKEETYDSAFRYFVEELRDELDHLNVIGDTIHATEVTENGSIVLQGLDYGYYLIDEISDLSGAHAASSLCMVSTANPQSAIKIKSDYPSVSIKIQEDDNREQIGNDGWNDMADYEIGQKVPYKVESIISDMNGYDTYYYAWHHQMDESLTFNPDSVKIIISNENRSYEIPKDKYTVQQQVNEDSFVIAISDLKNIVDKEFPLKDDRGHFSYGQKVTLTYQAVVNDQASQHTGIPGFENTVRLEFSNDPDRAGAGRTGYTPGDTVVCFTYGLNGLKVNDHNIQLKGAKFRLYLDEACTEEVHVKKAAEGHYTVISKDTYDKTAQTTADVHITSEEKGKFLITGLDAETYYLKEVEAPDGYRLLVDPIRIRIQASFSENRNNYVKGDGENKRALLKVQYFAHMKEFLNGNFKENETELTVDQQMRWANLTVINTIGSKLPITGSSATLIILGAGIAFMTAAGLFGKRKRLHE